MRTALGIFPVALAVDAAAQAAGWAVSAALKTEKLYDIFGSSTFLIVTLVSLATSLHTATPGSVPRKVS